MAGVGPRRGVAKSRRVRVNPVQPTLTDTETTNIAMTTIAHTCVLEGGGAISSPSSSSSLTQNKPFVPRPGRKLVVGSGATSREYEMCLPGEDPFIEENNINSCTFQMKGNENTEEMEYRLQWYKMSYDKLQLLRMQAKILQQFGVQHLVKDQERIPIIIQKAVAYYSTGTAMEKLIADHFDKKNISPSQKNVESGKQTVLESIKSAATDLEKFAAVSFGEVDEIMDLAILKSSLNEKMRAELEFQTLKQSELQQCCQIFKKHPAPKDELEQLSVDEEKYMIKPRYTPQYTEDEVTKQFSRILKYRLDQLLHLFPKGVEENVYWKRFCSGRGHKFKLIDYGLKSPSEATDLNRELFHICRNVDVGGRNTVVIPRRILFPACSKPKSTLDIIGYTHHKLKLIVCQSSDKSVQLTNQKIYEAVKFLEEDWGILGTGAGVKFVLEAMDELYGENSLTILNIPRKQVDILCENSPRCIQKIEKQFGVERKPEAKVLSDPQRSQLDVVPLVPSRKPRTSTLPPMTSFINGEYYEPVIPDAPIKSGETLKCKLKSNYGHDYFALAITDDKKMEMDSEKFFIDFRKHDHYKMAVQEKPDVNSTVFPVGTCVLAKRDKDREYNRASVLTVLQDSNKYEVLFVDTGIRSEVHFNHVRSLSHALQRTPAMTVVCSLEPGELIKEACETETGPVLQSIFDNAKELKATFHRFTHHADYKTKIWEISLNVRLRSKEKSEEWINVRDELQQQLAKKKNITKNRVDD